MRKRNWRDCRQQEQFVVETDESKYFHSKYHTAQWRDGYSGSVGYSEEAVGAGMRD